MFASKKRFEVWMQFLVIFLPIEKCMQDKGRPPVAPAQEQLENRPHDTTHQQWTINGCTFRYISYAGFDICVWVPLTLLLLPRKPTVWVSQGLWNGSHQLFDTLLQLWHQYQHLRITIPSFIFRLYLCFYSSLS